MDPALEMGGDARIAGLVVPSEAPYHRVLSLVFQRPLCLTAAGCDQVLAAIQGRASVNVQVLNAISGATRRPEAAAGPTRKQLRSVARSPGFDASTGIYTIAIHDKLVQRGGGMDAESGLESYDSIHRRVNAAMDPDVKGVFLWADSPGGQAAGMVQLGEAIRGLAKEKPVVTYVDELAASAGYGLVAGSSSIWLPETGEVGSIGVRWMHVSYAAAAEAQGLRVTEFTSGRKKIIGSPYKDIDEEAASYIQAQIDTMAESFFKLTTRGRSDLTMRSVRDLEGSVLMGQAAVDAKLADNVGSREDALSHLMSLMKERTRSVHSTGAASATPAATAANVERKPMNKILLTALALVPGCSAISAEDYTTDIAAAKVAEGVDKLRADADAAKAKATTADAELSAARATVDQLTAERDALTAKVAAFEAGEAKAKADAEAKAWDDALADADVVDAEASKTVRALAVAQAQAGETPAASVGRIKGQAHMSSCFVQTGEAKTTTKTTTKPNVDRTETSTGGGVTEPWMANVNLGIRN